jgi:phosphodiesterase/alkaline phosphatase D-like protein
MLNASVLPGGSETLVYFEVGTSLGVYDVMTSSVIRLNNPLWDNHLVSIPVTGLTAGTTYYYRVTSFNSESTGLTTLNGQFTTL